MATPPIVIAPPSIDPDKVKELYEKLSALVYTDLEKQFKEGKISGATYAETYKELMKQVVTGSLNAIVSLASKETAHDRLLKEAEIKKIAAGILQQECVTQAQCKKIEADIVAQTKDVDSKVRVNDKQIEGITADILLTGAKVTDIGKDSEVKDKGMLLTDEQIKKYVADIELTGEQVNKTKADILAVQSMIKETDSKTDINVKQLDKIAKDLEIMTETVLDIKQKVSLSEKQESKIDSEILLVDKQIEKLSSDILNQDCIGGANCDLTKEKVDAEKIKNGKMTTASGNSLYENNIAMMGAQKDLYVRQEKGFDDHKAQEYLNSLTTPFSVLFQDLDLYDKNLPQIFRMKALDEAAEKILGKPPTATPIP